MKEKLEKKFAILARNSCELVTCIPKQNALLNVNCPARQLISQLHVLPSFIGY